MLKEVINAFRAGSEGNPLDEGPWSFWRSAIHQDPNISNIPVSLFDDKKKSAFEYSSRGYKYFHPWTLHDLNPSDTNQYFQVVMFLLRKVDPIINEKEQYWLFRGDINIIMMWYRVRSCLFLCLNSLIDGMGG